MVTLSKLAHVPSDDLHRPQLHQSRTTNSVERHDTRADGVLRSIGKAARCLPWAPVGVRPFVRYFSRLAGKGSKRRPDPIRAPQVARTAIGSATSAAPRASSWRWLSRSAEGFEAVTTRRRHLARRQPRFVCPRRALPIVESRELRDASHVDASMTS